MRLKHGFGGSAAAVVLLLIAALAGCTAVKPLQQEDSSATPGRGAQTPQSPADVKETAENYIAKYFASEGEVKITSIWEEHGVYGFNVTVMDMNYTSYITKDGKIIFPMGFYTDRPPSELQAPPPEALPPEETPPS